MRHSPHSGCVFLGARMRDAQETSAPSSDLDILIKRSHRRHSTLPALSSLLFVIDIVFISPYNLIYVAFPLDSTNFLCHLATKPLLLINTPPANCVLIDLFSNGQRTPNHPYKFISSRLCS